MIIEKFGQKIEVDLGSTTGCPGAEPNPPDIKTWIRIGEGKWIKVDSEEYPTSFKLELFIKSMVQPAELKMLMDKMQEWDKTDNGGWDDDY
jgi:hypothetical protein